MLRVETVINQPGEFKVFREWRHRDGTTSWGMYPMCKGVGNFHHYQSQALSCNLRYLESLAAVEDPAPAYDDLRTLTERRRHQGHSYAGFNPAREEEARLFAAVLAGELGGISLMSEAFKSLGCNTKVSQQAPSKRAGAFPSPQWPPISHPTPVGIIMTTFIWLISGWWFHMAGGRPVNHQ